MHEATQMLTLKADRDIVPSTSGIYSRTSSCQLLNTAKLSSLTLQRISFQADTNPAPRSLGSKYKMSSGKTGRRRRSSSIIYHEPPESLEHISDQSALPNLNSQWVNAKGKKLPTHAKSWQMVEEG